MCLLSSLVRMWRLWRSFSDLGDIDGLLSGHR